MSILRGSYNLMAALVGLFVLPLGYLMIGKPMRGLMVSAAMILIAIFTAGIGLLVAYPLAIFDIATGGKMG
jgi:hypothetical protein